MMNREVGEPDLNILFDEKEMEIISEHYNNFDTALCNSLSFLGEIMS
jgi:hypothetical protein